MCRFLTFLITLSFFEKKVIYVEAEIYLLLRGGIREKLRDGEENNTELGWAGRKKIDINDFEALKGLVRRPMMNREEWNGEI